MEQLLRNIEISNHSPLAAQELLQIMTFEYDISCCFACSPIRIVLFRLMEKEEVGDGLVL